MSELNIPPTYHVTIHNCALGVAAACLWTSLLPDVTALPLLAIFNWWLKN